MSTLADVFRELNTLKADDLVRDYAIGGATAALFYAEPAWTYDIDVFVVLAGTAPAERYLASGSTSGRGDAVFPPMPSTSWSTAFPSSSFPPTTRWPNPQ